MRDWKDTTVARSNEGNICVTFMGYMVVGNYCAAVHEVVLTWWANAVYNNAVDHHISCQTSGM